MTCVRQGPLGIREEEKEENRSSWPQHKMPTSSTKQDQKILKCKYINIKLRNPILYFPLY